VIEDAFETAIRAFWSGRNLQTQRQVEAGSLDAGTRGAVTGGRHLDALASAIADLFRDGPLVGVEVRHNGKLTLPGYYRRAKDWDLVVTYKDVLVAAIELKSQVGSFGNNFNNRTEEAIGNAVDVWRAYQGEAFGPVRPWLGFVMVVEETDKSTTPLTRDPSSIYPADPVFDNTSYIDRYRILFRRLLGERLYDAAALVTTRHGEGISHTPYPELGLRNFEAAVRARITYISELDLNT